jgi:hypothetical protein
LEDFDSVLAIDFYISASASSFESPVFVGSALKLLVGVESSPFGSGTNIFNGAPVSGIFFASFGR